MAHRIPSPSLRWARLMAWALALPLAGSLQPARAATWLSFLSSPSSWVGGGETVSAGPGNGFAIAVEGDPSTTLRFSVAEPWTAEGSSRYWDLLLAAPEGARLAVGSYANASRWPFQEATAAGLSFSGNHRGNNRLTGSFTILEANEANDGSFSFAVDFLQYDEERVNSWIKGVLRYNSDVPIALLPEPIVVDAPIEVAYTPDPQPEPSIDEELPMVWYSGSSGSTVGFTSDPLTFTSMGFNPDPAPGPLPIAGALASWHSARRLRRRRLVCG